jgi:GAF domain-containing protein
MQQAPIPEFENERICAVQGLKILDTPPEERFDRLTREASEKLDVPISTLSILDTDREWYKSFKGVEVHEGARDISFCGHAMLADGLCIVEDTLNDARFEDNPLVTGPKPIRFYAGVALYDKESALPVGVFCVKDHKPRQMNEGQIAEFLNLAKKAEDELNKKV